MDTDTALRPVGAERTARALTVRTGWPVRTEHIPTLVAQGHLTIAGSYEGHPLIHRHETDLVPEQVVACLPAMPPSRPGPAINAFSTYLVRTYDLEVATLYRPRSGRWHLDWFPRPDGRPDPAGLRADLAAHPAGRYRRLIDLANPAHRAIAAARRALAPGAALILDTETTGLGADAVIVELAVIAADSGRVLLETLVSPDGVPIEPEAQRVHGIPPTALADAPTWPQVWPRLRKIAQNKTVIAYKADFDKRLVAQTGRRYGIAAPRWEWACAMAWRGAAARTTRPGRLGGSHRALGDAQAAWEVVRQVASTPHALHGDDRTTAAARRPDPTRRAR